jgi:hypothetical protein
MATFAAAATPVTSTTTTTTPTAANAFLELATGVPHSANVLWGAVVSANSHSW